MSMLILRQLKLSRSKEYTAQPRSSISILSPHEDIAPKGPFALIHYRRITKLHAFLPIVFVLVNNSSMRTT